LTHNDPIFLEKVTLDSILALQAIGTATFRETFAQHNSEENMQEYVASAFSIEKLNSELTTPYSEFYFARTTEQVLGYLKFNIGAAQTEIKDEQGAEIERIYVLQTFHGHSVGRILLDKAIELAKLSGKSYLWLGVWEKNERAIRFYEKHGFVKFDEHVFVLGDERQTDYMMRLDLEP
jgi:diamine N-acetyltransferase